MMFGEAVISYLFLGGTGAGMMLVLSVLGLFVPRAAKVSVVAGVEGDAVRNRPLEFVSRVDGVSAVVAAYRRLFVPGYTVALALLLVGIASLMVDLGHLDRILLLVVRPSLSYITVGAYALVACSMLALLLALFWGGVMRCPSYVLMIVAEVCSIALAVVVMVYSGLMLSSMGSVPLWNTLRLPLLFALSALSCGIAAVVGLLCATRACEPFGSMVGRLLAVDAVVIVVESLVALAFLSDVVGGAGNLVVLFTDPMSVVTDPALRTATQIAAREGAFGLVAGERSWVFCVGFGFLGLAIPFALELGALMRGRFPSVSMGVGALCVLMGGFALRLSVVECGIHPVMAMSGLG